MKLSFILLQTGFIVLASTFVMAESHEIFPARLGEFKDIVEFRKLVPSYAKPEIELRVVRLTQDPRRSGLPNRLENISSNELSRVLTVLQGISQTTNTSCRYEIASFCILTDRVNMTIVVYDRDRVTVHKSDKQGRLSKYKLWFACPDVSDVAFEIITKGCPLEHCSKHHYLVQEFTNINDIAMELHVNQSNMFNLNECDKEVVLLPGMILHIPIEGVTIGK